MSACDIGRPEYLANGYLTYYLGWCAQYRTETGGNDPCQYQLSVAREKIADSGLRERVYLLILNDFFSGEDACGEAEAVFAQECELLKEPKNKAALAEKYALFQKLAPGADAVDCEWSDAEGQVSLMSDLFGKVIYLDVWVTWCGPCCEEILYMEKLAEHFKNDPRIEIVSVSIDSRRSDWEAKLKKDKPQWK